MEIERRFYTAELRAIEEDGKPKIIGYAAVFNQLSEEIFGFQERIIPGAFTDSLADDIRALFNHDPNMILGRTLSKTLRISEDNIGLRYEITPPDTQYGRDLLESIKRGDVDQSSFGFRTIEDSWTQPYQENKLPIRTLLKVKLFDVSPVTFPAYPTTTVQVRSLVKDLIVDNHNPDALVRRLKARQRELDLIELI